MSIFKKIPLRVASLALVLVFCFSFIAPVADARGSLFIGNYTTSMSTGSNGNVTVWFQITGTGMMDQIGSTKVTIIENGTEIKTYHHTSTPGMMGYNKGFHGSSITYSGIPGRTYRAHVTYQCGKDGDWDNRSMGTNTVTAQP